MENIYALGAVVLISLISLLGALSLVLNEKLLRRITFLLVSLAAGALIGDVFLHLLPEINHLGEGKSIFSMIIIGGILAFFILEKILHWHHCHKEHNEEHMHPLAINNLVADGIHNFTDGLIIATAFTANTELGIATLIAILLHEIPQELGDFGILVQAGLKPKRALLFNFLSAIIAIIGAITGLIITSSVEAITPYLLSFAAGGFLYIAIADLFPEMHKEVTVKRGVLQLVAVLTGVILLYGITFIEPHDHGHSHESEHGYSHEEDEHYDEHHDEHSDDHEDEHHEEKENQLEDEEHHDEEEHSDQQ